MASTIRIKRSSVAGKIPTTSDISVGELAINVKDQKLYSSNGTSVFEIGGGGGGSFANTNPLYYVYKFTNSTLGVAPAAVASYDLAKDASQSYSETPFQTLASSVDAFGADLGAIYDCREPAIYTVTVDYGSNETYVGAT